MTPILRLTDYHISNRWPNSLYAILLVGNEQLVSIQLQHFDVFFASFAPKTQQKLLTAEINASLYRCIATSITSMQLEQLKTFASTVLHSYTTPARAIVTVTGLCMYLLPCLKLISIARVNFFLLYNNNITTRSVRFWGTPLNN